MQKYKQNKEKHKIAQATITAAITMKYYEKDSYTLLFCLQYFSTLYSEFNSL